MNTQEILKSLVETFENQITELKACKNNDWVLVFPMGLGVRFVGPEGKCNVCSLDKAESIVPEVNNMPEEAWGFTPVVKNGKGEQAKIMPRQAAIAQEVKVLEEHLATLVKKAA